MRPLEIRPSVTRASKKKTSRHLNWLSTCRWTIIQDHGSILPCCQGEFWIRKLVRLQYSQSVLQLRHWNDEQGFVMRGRILRFKYRYCQHQVALKLITTPRQELYRAKNRLGGTLAQSSNCQQQNIRYIRWQLLGRDATLHEPLTSKGFQVFLHAMHRTRYACHLNILRALAVAPE